MINIEVLYNGKTKTYKAKEGDNLLDFLISAGYYITASCGGKGTCGKCKVKLLSGNVKNAVKDGGGNVLSCQARIFEDIKIEVYAGGGSGLTEHKVFNAKLDKKQGFGMAVDIGTTTLAFYLMDLHSGREIENYSCLNPQGVYGADVISRITACKNGDTLKMQKLIVDKVRDVCRYFTDKHNIKKIKCITLCGNTTMMHIFAGQDATSLGHYPFTPIFTQTREFSGKDFNIEADNITLLPSVSAYVGSDITSGIVGCGLTKDGKTNMLIDIGTNGEVVLYDKGQLFCASTAAGPAFEGANITCGMGGVKGAVDSVVLKDGKLSFTVIGGVEPKGICGSALIDIIAVMLQQNLIDYSGLLQKNNKSTISDKIDGDKFYITSDIFISQKDIREFQLAKSAICAGIKTLVKTNGLKLADISQLMVAGGLGFYINYKNAVACGLIPNEFDGKISVVGNSAGSGAKLCLLSSQALQECKDAAEQCKNTELSASAEFMEEYIENINF